MSVRGMGSRSWALGGLTFAAVLLLMKGIWQVFLGIGAIARSEFFIVDPTYSYEFTAAVWGWIHLLLGLGIFAVGLALFSGEPWARLVGMLAAVLSAIAHFLFLPYYPIGSLVVILVAIFVIWSLATAPSPPEPAEPTVE